MGRGIGQTASKLLANSFGAAFCSGLCFMVLGENPDANLKLNAVSYIVVAAIWAYYDGIFTKRMWLMAFLEAIFLHLAAVQVGNFLALVFGNPLLKT